MSKCDKCGGGICYSCNDDGDRLRTCANCDRALCYKCCKVQYCQAYEDCFSVVCNDCQPKDWECAWCGDIDDYHYNYDTPKVKCSDCFKDSSTHCCRCHKKKIDEKDYKSPSIPRSYWVSLGYDEAYIGAMETFLQKLKMTTLILLTGEQMDYQEVCLDGGGYNDNGAPLLLHDDMLLPHWGEFACALKGYKIEEPTAYGGHRFTTSNVQLHPTVLAMLKEAFHAVHFKKLEFMRSFVDNEDGLKFIIDHVQKNPILGYLDWDNNPVDTVEHINHLIEVINSHPSLCRFRLNQICGTNVNGYDILPSIVALLSGSKTYDINLSSNNICTNGGTLLSDVIATNNPRLKDLRLNNNCLDDDDIVLIADALKHNTNLKCIRLNGNNVSNIGHSALRGVIFNETSFNLMASCNHTCHIGVDEIEYDINNSSFSGGDIGKKIYLLFSIRNREGTNVQHMELEFGEDLLLKLVPNVCQFVMRNSSRHDGGSKYYSDKSTIAVRPLSILYEVIRKLPSQDNVSQKMENSCVIS